MCKAPRRTMKLKVGISGGSEIRVMKPLLSFSVAGC